MLTLTTSVPGIKPSLKIRGWEGRAGPPQPAQLPTRQRRPPGAKGRTEPEFRTATGGGHLVKKPETGNITFSTQPPNHLFQLIKPCSPTLFKSSLIPIQETCTGHAKNTTAGSIIPFVVLGIFRPLRCGLILRRQSKSRQYLCVSNPLRGLLRGTGDRRVQPR